jgi:hypothetical protein
MAKTKQKQAVQERDSTYFLKIVLYIVVASFWIKFPQPIMLGDFTVYGFPLGLLVGLLFATHYCDDNYLLRTGRDCGVMRRLLLPLLSVVAAALFFATPQEAKAEQDTAARDFECNEASLYCPTSSVRSLSSLVKNYPTPNVTPPQSPIATPPITVRKPATMTVTYDVTTRGTITADLATFKAQAAETYADSRGWSRLGVVFKEVAGGGQFTLVLSEAGQMPSFGQPCDEGYSCQVGRYVIINQDRWQGATDPWNQAGGDLRNYRHMVVNHETGHWLGHGHAHCNGAGQAAAVMQQQSINLEGCKFNPWPLDSEIWSTRLGI